MTKGIEAKRQLIDVLEKSKNELYYGQEKEFKTLMDSSYMLLSLTIDRMKEYSSNENINILREIQLEVDNLIAKASAMVDKALISKDYKQHRDWIIAYSKIEQMIGLIKKKIAEIELRKQLQQYKGNSIYRS